MGLSEYTKDELRIVPPIPDLDFIVSTLYTRILIKGGLEGKDNKRVKHMLRYILYS